MKKIFITVAVILICGCSGYQKNYSTYSEIQKEQIKAARDVNISHIENWKAVELEKAKMLSLLLGIKHSPYMKVSNPVVSKRSFEPVSADEDDLRLVNVIKSDGSSPNIEVANGMQTFATYLILSEYLKSNNLPVLRMPAVKVGSVQAPISPMTQVAGILKQTMPAVELIGGTLAVGSAVKGLMKQAGDWTNYNGSFNRTDRSDHSINDSYKLDSWSDSSNNAVTDFSDNSNNAVTGSYNPDSSTDTVDSSTYEFKYSTDYNLNYEDNSTRTVEQSIDINTDMDIQEIPVNYEGF